MIPFRKLSSVQLQQVLDTYGNGLLVKGQHQPEEGLYCGLECKALADAIEWEGNTPITMLDSAIRRTVLTDNPQRVGMPDIRSLNDARWSSDATRTRALLPLIAALSDWSCWSKTKQMLWTILVSVHTVNRIVARLPGVSPVLVQQCLGARTIYQAHTAAFAVVGAAASVAFADPGAAPYAAASVAYGPVDVAAIAAATTADIHAANAHAAAETSAAAHAAAAAASAAIVNAIAAVAFAAAKAAAHAAASAAIVAYAAATTAEAADAAADSVLRMAVDIWLTAVIESEGI